LKTAVVKLTRPGPWSPAFALSPLNQFWMSSLVHLSTEADGIFSLNHFSSPKCVV
jgi:hypothetical protein